MINDAVLRPNIVDSLTKFKGKNKLLKVNNNVSITNEITIYFVGLFFSSGQERA